MPSVFDFYTRQVLTRPKACLALAFFLALVFAWCGKDVRLNNHFAVLFSVDNDANAYRHFYREVFGADDALLVAVLQPEVVDEVFFDTIADVTAQLEQNSHFIKVHTPTNTSIVHDVDDAVSIDPLFGIYDHGQLSLDEKLALMRDSPITANRLVSRDSDTFALMAQMPQDYDRYNRIREPAGQFRDLVDGHFADQVVTIDYAGIAFTRIGILQLMMQDLVMLVPLTGLAIAIFSLWLFRRWLIVWATLLTSLFGLAATIGVMGLRNDDVNQLTLTFPVLLMVIIVANSIHFYHRYFREIHAGQTVADAVQATARRVGRSAFLSCFTTMIGFYALMTAEMAILRSFGLYLGSGVMLSYLGMILIIPPCLLLNGPRPCRPLKPATPDWIDRTVMACISPQGRRKVTVLGVVLLAAGAWVASQASYDYFLSDMLDDDHPQVLASEKLDKYLSGALPVEVSLLAGEDDFKHPEILQKMQQLEQWLQLEAGSQSTLSLASVVASMNQAMVGEYRVPDNAFAIAQLLLLAEGSSDGVVQELVNDDYSHARIRSNLPDLGADRIMQLQHGFHAYADKLMQGTGVSVRMTGEIPVAYEGMNKLTEELIKSVLTAMFFVVLTIFAVFRDIRLAIGCIFPNLFPIIIGLGIYALSGHALNPLPGIAFCIAIGIAVDDTVHLFARFNEELTNGLERNDAIVKAVQEVKGALISSSVMLTAGFAMFLLSAFTWNRELGMLGAVLIISALIADLLFTPAVLSFRSWKGKKGT